MSVQDKPAYAAGVGHESRARIEERTLRTDRWWLSPLLYVIGFTAWLIYGVVHDGLDPIGLAFVFGEDIGELRVRLVNTGVAGGRDSFRRPHNLIPGPGAPGATRAGSGRCLCRRGRRCGRLLGRQRKADR